MAACIDMKWLPFLRHNISYDLSHLHPKHITYVQPSKADKPAIQYKVSVSFSMHCFTRGLKEKERPDRTMLYSDARETRVFDFQRYELSKELPEIIQNLSNRKCYHTGKGNFFTVELVGDLGQKVEYDVFFEASRIKGLVLFVQRAYVRDAQHRSRPRAKPIRFEVILYNTLHDSPSRLRNSKRPSCESLLKNLTTNRNSWVYPPWVEAIFWRYQHATLKSHSVYMLTVVILLPGEIRNKSFLEQWGKR